MQKSIVMGVKRSQGVLENGKAYDTTKVYIQTKMKDNLDQAGYSVSEFNWGNSLNFDKISKLKFPFEANVEFEMTTNGKTTQIVVTDIQPIKA